MKNIISSIICAGAVMLLLASCDTKTETKVLSVPALTLSPTSVSVSSGKVEQYTINYSVSNPASDGVISASSDVSWLSGVDVSVSGQVRFAIAENTAKTLRTGCITIAYSYSEGGSGYYVTEKTAVVQYGAGDPALTVDPNAVTASYGGGSYSFDYNVENAVDGGEIECKSSVSWLSGFDYSDYGTVGFTVDSNSGEELRTGTITVAYVWNGGEVTKEVTVVQDHSGADTYDGELIGTYTATGLVYGGISVMYEELTEVEWTLRIYPYTGSLAVNSQYQYWIDGLVPDFDGAYNNYGDHRCSAGAYISSGGTLHIPSQMANASYNNGQYYLVYTPCIDYDPTDLDYGWHYSSDFPDLTFNYYSSTDTWISNFGVFEGISTTPYLTGFYSFYQAVAGTFTLTKISSDTTSLSTESVKRTTDPLEADATPHFHVSAK